MAYLNDKDLPEAPEFFKPKKKSKKVALIAKKGISISGPSGRFKVLEGCEIPANLPNWVLKRLKKNGVI